MSRLLLCTLAVVLAVTAAPAAAKRSLTALNTPHSFQSLVQRLDQAVKANGMFVVTRASASVGAANRGIRIPGNMVVGVFRNDFSLRLLEASISAGIEAPIRFYITEDANGTATLSYWTPSDVLEGYDGGEALRLLAWELDGIFASIAQQAAAP
jgi:uncharacterized protein (DUF302 family)